MQTLKKPSHFLMDNGIYAPPFSDISVDSVYTREWASQSLPGAIYVKEHQMQSALRTILYTGGDKVVPDSAKSYIQHWLGEPRYSRLLQTLLVSDKSFAHNTIPHYEDN